MIVPTEHVSSLIDRKWFAYNLWCWKCGVPERVPKITPPLEELKEHQWSEEFEQLRFARMLMGGYRYGDLRAQFKERAAGGRRYDYVAEIKRRVGLYEQSGNQEHLVDAANMCMIEFMHPQRDDAHFVAVDDGTHAVDTA